MRVAGMIVEDLSAVRDWLAGVCARVFPDVAVTACCDLASARTFLRRFRCEETELAFALVDLGLPDGSGIDLIRELSLHHPGTLPVVVTIYGDDRRLFDAIAAGAQGYLLKDDDPEAIESNLQRIRRGEPPLSPAVARRMIVHFRDIGTPSSVELTQQETRALALLGLGMRIQDVGREMGISVHTARDHVKAIYGKLNISSRAEAAVEAVRRGLV